MTWSLYSEVVVLEIRRCWEFDWLCMSVVGLCCTVLSLEKVVYSTCSTHQRENEDVVIAVLPEAKAKGFELACPYPRLVS